jgi:HlyD family secretion protein
MREEQEKELPRLSEQEKDEELDISSIEIRSEEVQEIMGFIPHWIIRWGITLFFLVIGVFVMGSFFFKYPDVIQSTIVVTTETPPAAIVARTTGKIQRLFVQDNQKVNADEAIALLETAANYQHVLELKEKLETLKEFFPHYDATGSIQFDRNYSMGELQSIYTIFLKSYGDYEYFIRLDYHKKKIEATQQEIDRQKSLYETGKRQTALMEQDFEVSRQKYERFETLHKENVISESEFESAKSTFLQKEYTLEGARSSLESQKIQLGRLEQNIMDLGLQYKEQKKQLELSLNGAYDNLAGQIAQWEQNYLLKTPISGVVTFTKFWSENQNVRAGDTVFTVIPDNAGEMLGKMVLPVAGSGKVKVGQQVNIKFLNYPHVEYGMVRGIIKARSLVASDNNYILEVELPNGLNTSYDKVLPFSQEMQGIAEIITEDIRLLERVFKPIKSLLKNV